MTVGTKPEIKVPLAQISEVTGITDTATIMNAWNNCFSKGGTVEDITADVIASLLGPSVSADNASSTSPTLRDKALASLPSTEPRVRSNSMETQVESTSYSKPVSDEVTGDNDDMQKAIAASLVVQGPLPSMLGGQITKEDQDISRVLEQSLADTKPTDLRKTSVWFFNDARPYERRRDDSWPVGLKNVGNTCWFNAVIQSLFHMEAFRNLVTSYEPNDTLKKDHHIAVFMVELGRLFALMLASDRKYLDPTAVVDILKQSFSSNSDGQSMQTSNDQQDVSEFQHKLQDWLEEAFEYKSGSTHNADKSAAAAGDSNAEPMEVEESVQEKNESNDMVKLFYGKVKAFGSNAGEPFSTHTHFGQWPLYVAGFSDIHGSLEAGLAKGDIETNNAEQISNQEQWFTKLPPVLTFELSRFSYNTMQSQAEKLHNKFSFPQTLYLDRYMEVNREEVIEKRSRLSRLQTELTSLQTKLHKYTHYGNGDEHYPLHDILNYALQFTTSVSPAQSTSSQTNSADVESLPQPKNISSNELSVLTSCLTRWKEEVKGEIAQYESEITRLQHEISEAYEPPHLKKHKYCLHAVMVHEGEAISGHYWSYVYNRQTGLWLKFNDVCVDESSWEDVVKESEGGNGKASAYCLIYTQDTDDSASSSETNQSTIRKPADQDFPSKEEALAKLRPDLQRYALQDNENLLQEIKQWERSKSAIQAGGTTSSSSSDYISNMDVEPRNVQLAGSIKTEVDDLASSHAQSMTAMIRLKLAELEKLYGTTISWSFKLELLIKHCFDRYTEFSRDYKLRKKLDTRAHFIGYLLIVYGPSIENEDIKTLIADQVARLEHTSDITGWSNVQHEAVKLSSKYWDNDPQFQMDYNLWHQEFNTFRVVLSLFVEGLTLFNAERYEDALPYLHDAFIRNQEIILSIPQIPPDGSNFEMKHLDTKLLSEIRNACIQKFNDMAFSQFESEEDYTTPLRVMLTHVLPILDTMQDTDFAGVIKDRWVTLMVDESIEEHRMASLKEFIGQLFEAAVSPAPTIDEVKLPVDLRRRCKHEMSVYASSTN